MTKTERKEIEAAQHALYVVTEKLFLMTGFKPFDKDDPEILALHSLLEETNKDVWAIYDQLRSLTKE